MNEDDRYAAFGRPAYDRLQRLMKVFAAIVFPNTGASLSSNSFPEAERIRPGFDRGVFKRYKANSVGD